MLAAADPQQLAALLPALATISPESLAGLLSALAGVPVQTLTSLVRHMLKKKGELAAWPLVKPVLAHMCPSLCRSRHWAPPAPLN